MFVSLIVASTVFFIERANSTGQGLGSMRNQNKNLWTVTVKFHYQGKYQLADRNSRYVYLENLLLILEQQKENFCTET
jgi:hypothetical protein